MFLVSGCYLSRWAAGAEHGVEVFDEEFGEDVDRHQSSERDRTVTRPNKVYPEDTGQVRRTHLVHDALLGHLRRTDQSKREKSEREGPIRDDLII